MKKMTALLLAVLMVLSMAACASKPAEESDLAYIQDKGTLVVGITDFAPMDYQNESGEWIGFDADLAKAFADSLGVKVEFVEIVWDNKVLELDSKTIDCVWNGMTLTPEVTSAMACSNAYCNNAQVVIVPADKAADYQTVESVKDLTFAAEAGSAGEAELNALGYSVTPVSAQSDALMEVAAGTSDAAVIDSLMAAAMVGEGTGYANSFHSAPGRSGSMTGCCSFYLKVNAGHIHGTSFCCERHDRHGFLQTVCPEASCFLTVTPSIHAAFFGSERAQRMDQNGSGTSMLWNILLPQMREDPTPRATGTTPARSVPAGWRQSGSADRRSACQRIAAGAEHAYDLHIGDVAEAVFPSNRRSCAA